MSKLGDYILKIRNRFAKQNEHTSRLAMNYAETKEIGLLFNVQNESSHEALNDLVNTLKKDGKHITALAYFEREHSNPYDFAFDFFRKKDISTLGVIKSEEVERFIQKPFDYLYCIHLQTFPPFDYILMHSQAKCRIGKHFEGKESEFELMISLDESETESALIQRMLAYTKKLERN